MLSILTVLVVSYLLTCSITYVMARVALADRAPRLLFVILGFLTPPLAVWALVKTIFERSKPLPYNEELARIEDEIETERVAIFGGQPLKPSVSEAWKVSYLRWLTKAARKVESAVEPNSTSSLFAATTTLK